MGQGMGGMMGGNQSSNNNQDSGGASASTGQKSFLDGNFAGGWQSNADLPDRRHIIFSILEVIKQMRPDTNKISQKYVSRCPGILCAFRCLLILGNLVGI